MTDREELKRLAELAKAATPGPWYWNDKDQLVSVETRELFTDYREPIMIIETDSGVYPPFLGDREFIAATNPSAILDLISQLEAREAEIAELKTARDYNARDCLKLQDEILAQGAILRNAIAMVNEQERTIHELRASRDADVERLSARLGKVLGERPTKAENPNFKCKHCGSHDLWYTSGETSDGAYDTYHYHCHACEKQWRVVAEID